MEKPPAAFRAARILILVCAAIWLIFAGIVVSGSHPSYSGGDPFRWIMSGLAFLAGLALLTFYFFLGRRNRLVYVLGVAFLFLILVLTVTDQVGWVDLAVLIVTLTPIVLLLVVRKWYFRRAPESK